MHVTTITVLSAVLQNIYSRAEYSTEHLHAESNAMYYHSAEYIFIKNGSVKLTFCMSESPFQSSLPLQGVSE